MSSRNTKYLAVAIMFICLALVFHSCEENIRKSDTEAEIAPFRYDQLTHDLANYTDSYISYSETKTPFWRSLGRIVECDAMGALLGSKLGHGGSLVGAICFSLYQLVVDNTIGSQAIKSNDLSVINIDNCLLYDCDSSLCFPDSLGILHNTIIASILEDHPNIQNVSSSNLDSLILKGVEDAGYGNLMDQELDFNYFHTLYESIPVDSLYAYICVQFPEFADEMQVVHIYSEAIANLDVADICEYSEGFLEILDESLIDDSSLDVIKGTISVAGSSALLWSEANIDIYD